MYSSYGKPNVQLQSYNDIRLHDELKLTPTHLIGNY